MWRDSVNAWLIIVLACFLLYSVYVYYLKIPLMVIGRMWFAAQPAITECDESSEQLWPEARDFFAIIEVQLRSLGFLSTQLLFIKDSLPRQIAFVAVFANEHAGDQAAAYALENRPLPDLVRANYSCEFITPVNGEHYVNSTNSSNLDVVAAPWKSVTIFPGLLDLDSLYQAHRTIVEKRGCERRGIATEGIVSELIRLWDRDMRWREARKLVRCNDDGTRYEVTWRYLPCLLRHRWPFKQFGRWRNVRRARRALRLAGLPSLYKASEYTDYVAKYRKSES